MAAISALLRVFFRLASRYEPTRPRAQDGEWKQEAHLTLCDSRSGGCAAFPRFCAAFCAAPCLICDHRKLLLHRPPHNGVEPRAKMWATSRLWCGRSTDPRDFLRTAEMVRAQHPAVLLQRLKCPEMSLKVPLVDQHYFHCHPCSCRRGLALRCWTIA